MRKFKNWGLVNAILLLLVMLTACDDDFNTVGAEIIKGVGFEKGVFTSSPRAYTQTIEKVQTSNLPYYYLGNFNDPTYGLSEYDLLGQVIPRNFPVDFGDIESLDSVILYLPYLNTIDTPANTEENTTATYSLDSIFGNEQAAFGLKVFKSNYFLRDTNVGNENTDEPNNSRQRYFSSDLVPIDSQISNENSLLFEQNNLKLSAAAIRNDVQDGDDADMDKDITFLEPGLYIKLPTTIFDDLFLKPDNLTSEFSNRNNFVNFFRGIYFDFIKQSDDVLFAVNLANSNLNLYYTEERKEDDSEEVIKEVKSVSLGFTGNNVNGILETPSLEIPDANVVEGDTNLYIKGGPGSYAVIDLFSRRVVVDENNEPVLDNNGKIVFTNDTSTNSIPEIDFLREQNWIINNAALRLYVNQEALELQGTIEPDRIYAFDKETGQRLVDFCNDLALNELTITNHLPPLERGTDDKGVFYEINVTSYINSLIQEEEDSDLIGIAVSQNVTIESGANCVPTTPAQTGDSDVLVPFSSVISPKGTILYGNTQQVPADKRLRLTISYSQSIRE